jgi:hypothetical protein
MTTLGFFDMWVRHHGMLEVIVSDRNAKFMSKFWTLLVKKAKTKLKFSTHFHLQTNGQTKRVNGILNQYLRNYVAVDHKDWGHKLNLAEVCYNSIKHFNDLDEFVRINIGMEVKQPLDLVVPHMMGYRKDGGRNAKIMVKEHKELNVRGNKLLEEAQIRYKNMPIKLRKRSSFTLATS